MIDGTTGVADFPKLRDHQLCFADADMPANLKGRKIQSLGGDILGKITGYDIQAFGPHGVDAFLGEKAHLAVPFTAMGIMFQTEIDDKLGRIDIVLSRSFPVADGDCLDCIHWRASYRHGSRSSHDRIFCKYLTNMLEHRNGITDLAPAVAMIPQSACL
jgi:hypothetical protein